LFRRLSTRLTAAYVFAAIVLVVIVVAAVTAFALSMYGIIARESSADLARQVPEEVRMQVSKSRPLRSAAPDIVRHLMRPGLHVIVFGMSGTKHFAAGEDPNGQMHIFWTDHGRGAGAPPPGGRLDDAPPGAPPGTRPDRPPGDRFDGPPPFGPGNRFSHMRPFPFGLNGFLGIEQTTVAIPGGWVRIIPDPDDLTRTINAFWLSMIPIGLFVVGAAWLFGRTIAAQALRPLVETTESLARFGAGDFTPRPVLTGDRNEIGALVEAYNRAAAQVSAAFEERRAAELRMRQFVADAGHELRTPLTVIMGFIDVLRRRAAQEPAISTKIYDTMLAESRRMKSLIDKLIVLARLENHVTLAPAEVDVADVASEVVVGMQALSSSPRIAFNQPAPGVFVRADRHELHDALSNLVENALKYAPESPVDVSVAVDGIHAVVEVSDYGPGIPADEQQLVFDRFYRGRDRVEAEGFGLGLAIAKRAVERAGGRLSVMSRVGEGSRFTIRLPRSAHGDGAAIAV
jgi:signal transduction histidine kinase